MQLDFVAITVHAHWPEIPVNEPRLKYLADYHQRGFHNASQGWDKLQKFVSKNYHPDQFVPFLAFEWHSNQFGDHNIYFNGEKGEIIRANSLEALRNDIREWQKKGIDAIAIPHHIGYKRGFRGINWDTFKPGLSPVVEIMSMHGASESPDAPYPYLHTMGPRDWQSTYQYGLSQGHIVGCIGSTDHHSAHPGSYGHGRLAVWSDSLKRAAIWEAIKSRCTYALTGDKIKLAFSINDGIIGNVLPPAKIRNIKCKIQGGGAIDYVDVLHNNQIIHRSNNYPKVLSAQRNPFSGTYKIHIEMGWGEKGVNVDWQAELDVVKGKLVDVEPRFRGHDVVAPQGSDEESYTFSQWVWEGKNDLAFSTRTWGNSTTTTNATQGIALDVRGDEKTFIKGQVNGVDFRVPLSELIAGPKSFYLGNFLTPAFYFHRAVSEFETNLENEFTHRSNSQIRDWYYVRVRQHNGQMAWSSPIWVEK
jgi:hypothetical protein